MSQTIYARVPDAIKQSADRYAEQRGVTLAAAVADLLDRGLRATAAERSAARLEQQVARLSAEVDSLRLREQSQAGAYATLAQRIALPVGTCPNCGGHVTGRDLLVLGHCPNPECSSSLASAIGPVSPPGARKGGASNGIDENEFRVLLGALGLLVGIAIVTSK